MNIMLTIVKIQPRNYNLPLSFIWVSKNIINARYIIPSCYYYIMLLFSFINRKEKERWKKEN